MAESRNELLGSRSGNAVPAAPWRAHRSRAEAAALAAAKRPAAVASIALLPLGHADEGLVESVAGALRTAYDLPCAVLAPEPVPAFAYREDRHQHGSTDLLRWLAANRTRRGAKLLAMIQHDLYSSVFDFVYGEAALGKDAALFSTFRLRNELYRLPPSPGLLRASAAKEAVHQVGHSFGLTHCAGTGCVMRFSEAVGLFDLKRATLCPSCAADAPSPARARTR